MGRGAARGDLPTSSSELFDREAYNRFSLPKRIGEAISGWDDPEMAPASEAPHMREDDCVVGMELSGHARAYPLWIIDNYHVVNDRLGDARFIVTSCERCQSGSAFLATPPGNPEREPLFRAVGFLNAVLLMKDLRSGSHWNHYDGLGLNRRAAGVRLPWIPTWLMEWRDWRALHPDTSVMRPPNDPGHPDARHGHGREEFFARPGMDPTFVPTILGELDHSYPENEMVLGVVRGGRASAFPLREVQREGGVVHPDVDDGFVVFAGPRPEGFTMSAFVPSVEERTLRFERAEGLFRDRETASGWTIEGKAVDGPLRGRRLEPVPWSYVRWHSWIYMHRETEPFRSGAPLPALAERTGSAEMRPFEPLASALCGSGREVLVATPLVTQRRPHESVASLTLLVDGHRVHLHRFAGERAARDFDAFRGAWSAVPYRPTMLEGRTRRLGTVVVHSDPEVRFVDAAQVLLLSHRLLRWSPLLDDADLERLAEAFTPSGAPDEPGFVEVVRALRVHGFDVINVGFLPPSQLPVGGVNGVGLTINADQFLLYRFGSEAAVREYEAGEPHTFAFGRFALRSTPDTMYVYQAAEILYAGDDAVRWSPLLQDPEFRRVVGEVAAT